LGAVCDNSGLWYASWKGRVKFFEKKFRESVWSGYGEPGMELGEVNVFFELEMGDSCICQKSGVVAIYMQDSGQGQVETSMHFFVYVCFALDLVYRRFWRKWGSTIASQRPRFCVGVS